MHKPLSKFALIESLPLPVFLVFAELVYRGVLQGWLSTYIVSSIVAVITTSILIYYKVSLNRFFIGINLYLLSGCYGLLSDQIWLNQLYGEMAASGMLAWIILVGVLSLLLSPTGFIGVKSPDRKKIIVFSLILLLVAVITFLFSYHLQGNRFLSDFIPFVTLFTTLAVFKSKLANHGSLDDS